MTKPADLAHAVELARLFFKSSDEQHILIHLKERCGIVFLCSHGGDLGRFRGQVKGAKSLSWYGFNFN